MKTEKKVSVRAGERGNVLFLILIAVALFAALSYAVTQSTRSGGGDANKETNLINSAQVTQYPAGIRTSIIRMMVSGGVAVEDLLFDPPSTFAGLSDTDNAVFYPTGGGATYQEAPADVMASGAGTWHFNANFEIPDIGLAGANGNELIAFLHGVSQSVCQKVNEELGIGSTIPTWDPTDADVIDDLIEGDTFPTADQADFPTAPVDLSGQPFGCFQDTSDSSYTYYHVLIER